MLPWDVGDVTWEQAWVCQSCKSPTASWGAVYSGGSIFAHTKATCKEDLAHSEKEWITKREPSATPEANGC